MAKLAEILVVESDRQEREKWCKVHKILNVLGSDGKLLQK